MQRDDSGAVFVSSVDGHGVALKPLGDRPRPRDKTRVCCISDTHNVQDVIVLPTDCDLLVHAGDVLTESLLRHVEKGACTPKGVELFERFAEWFCRQIGRAHV